MKLRESRTDKWSLIKVFKGQKKGVKYEITENTNGNYYVLAYDTKKDLTFNSLWLKLEFETVKKAQEWCENSPNIEELRNLYFNKK